MKRVCILIFVLAALSLSARGQFTPPPFASYEWNGSAWVPLATTGSAQALSFTPPSAALYCFNSSLGQWVAGDSSCFGGGGGGSGTVTSVALTGSANLFSSTPGTPVTVSGTLNADSQLATQAANCLVAGPTTGAAAQPTCRALVNADFPGTLAPTFSGANLTSLPAQAFSALTGGTNTGAAMVVGTGASLATSGSGTITATAVPFSGVSAATNTNALVVGTGGSLATSGSGTIAATSAPFSGVAAGTNTNALVIGTGGSLAISGTGTIAATSVTGLSVVSGKTLTVNNSITLAGTDATTMTFPSVTATIPGVGVANTFSAAQTISVAGAASTPALFFTGALETGGTGTTNFPHVFFQHTGTAATTWGTNGTVFGANLDSGSTANFIDFKLNGATTSAFKVASTGALSVGANISITANGNGVNSGGGITLNFTAGSALQLGSNSTNGVCVLSTTDAFTCGQTTFTVSGCGTAAAVTGNGTVGSFTVGTGATNCTFTVTINGATGATAAHGWVANADDTTANIHCVNSTTVSTTTAVFVCTGTIATSDLIKFSTAAY